MRGGQDATLDTLVVLVICADRKDRKLLFDSFDELGVGAIYTAQNPEQGAGFFAQDTIDLLLIDLGFESEQLKSLIANAKESAQQLRVLGLHTRQPESLRWPRELDRFEDVIEADADIDELRFRVLKAMDSKAALSADDSLELLFDNAVHGAIILTPGPMQIRKVNHEFLRCAGGNTEDWIGRDFEELPLKIGRAVLQAQFKELEGEGQASFPCIWVNVLSNQWHCLVSMRFGLFEGRVSYLVVFEDTNEQTLGRLTLEILSRGELQLENHESGQIVDSLAQVLKLDVLHAVAVDDDTEEQVVLAAFSRGEIDTELLDQSKHRPLKKILAGESLVAVDAAPEVIGADKFIASNKFRSYLGLPLNNVRGEVKGALIAASRTPLPFPHLGVSALRILAAQLGQHHEIRNLVTQSEDRGLHDTLTYLPNRVLFNDRLDSALKDAQRTGETFALMFVDVDRFKTINDSLGHSVGDQVLIGFAEKLRSAVRSSDTVARYAGDEFVLILRHVIQRDDVMRMAGKLNKLLAEPIPLEGGEELQVTASIGICFYPEDGSSAETLLKRADMAMYSAKGMGRDTAQAFETEAEEPHQQKLVLESKLRRAQQNDELKIYYQPQVDCETEDIVGMEALLRWEHPELGLISPGFFIPLAEETGLIVSIGKWLLTRACLDAKAWQEQFGIPLTLGVNLSPLQLRQPELVDDIAASLESTGLRPEFLDLEVTESLNIKQIPELREKLTRLRELGCRISIDDFGTGQSSLDYLKRFPADRIKIDQSFVRNIGIDPDDEAIIKATIEMAHGLGMEVVAEGVEEEEHLDYLRRNRSDQLQGFLFCRPLDARAFEDLLTERETLLAQSRQSMH